MKYGTNYLILRFIILFCNNCFRFYYRIMSKAAIKVYVRTAPASKRYVLKLSKKLATS